METSDAVHARHSRPRARLTDLFDQVVALYYVALEVEDWHALWEAADLIDEVQRLEERVP